MTNKRGARFAAAFLSIITAITFSLAFTQESYAASGSSGKYLLPAKITVKYAGVDGGRDTFTHKFRYNRNGLLISWRGSDGRKITYTRNKRGGITREVLNNNGTIDRLVSYKLNSKGLPVIGKDETGGKYRFSYKNGKMYKERYDSDELTNFYPTGLIKTYKYDNDDVKELRRYDKHGNLVYSEAKGFPTETIALTYENNLLVREVKTSKEKGKKKQIITTSYEYTYDKAGRIIGIVSTTEYSDYKAVGTTKYKYSAKGALIKETSTSREEYSDGTVNKGDVWTYTFKYKSVKVAKKYRKFVYDRLPEYGPGVVSHYEIMPYGLTLPLR